MAPAARATHLSIAVVGAIALLAACKDAGSSSSADRPNLSAGSSATGTAAGSSPGLGSATAGSAASLGSATAGSATAGSAEPDRSSGKIAISITRTPPKGSGLARRCALAGDPLTSPCSARRGGTIAFDRAGLLHVVDGARVRRYRAAAGEECRFDPGGAPIELPPENPRPQRLDGPVYMRSGGPDWRLVAAPDGIYAHDFLGGLYKIDGGMPRPTCTDEFGYSSVVRLGKRWLVQRAGIAQLELRGRGKCKLAKAGIDDKSRDQLYVVADQLYTAPHAGGTLVHRVGGTATQLAAGTRVCAITAVAACGDGICALDHNCPQIVQIASTGEVRVLDDKLFDTRPYSLDGMVSSTSGALYLVARHRDAPPAEANATCETAVYRLLPDVFAR